MLIAKNSIDIEKSVHDVWQFLTVPDIKHDWISKEGWLVSTWQLDAPVVWKDANGADYARGNIEKREEEKVLSFNIHDAYEEDTHDPEDGEPDWNIQHFQFTLEALSANKTKLTLEIWDYDVEHGMEWHDHEEATRICKDMKEKDIPKRLEYIRAQIAE